MFEDLLLFELDFLAGERFPEQLLSSIYSTLPRLA